MTHMVLQSDIDLTKRLMAAGCQESGIIAWLCWRGVDQQEAAKLVQDLCNGGRSSPLFQEDTATYLGQAHRHRTRTSRFTPSTRPARLHHRRLPWHLVVKRVFWRSVGATFCILILFSFALVGYGVYLEFTGGIGASPSNQDLARQANLRRWGAGLPIPVSDFGVPTGSRSVAAFSDFASKAGLPSLPTFDRLMAGPAPVETKGARGDYPGSPLATRK
jgi:hypothetical protein